MFFLADYSVADYQNSHPFTEEQLVKIEKNIRLRKEYLKRHGIDYYIMIVADKNRVYGEYYPEYIHKLYDYGRGKQLVAYLKKNNIDVI